MTVSLNVDPKAPAPRGASSALAERHFPVTGAELERVSAAILAAAKAGGASAAETEVSQAVGQSVTVRHGEVETIHYNRDKGIGVTVFVGKRRGNASTADFSDESIRATVDKALAIARYTAEDDAAGLADPARLAKSWPDLDLYHPWDLSVERAIELGREAEAAALRVDPRITNSEGATVARGESEFVYANSLGFSGGYRSSRHHIDCSVIGEDHDAMQRDYWYTAARAPEDLLGADVVGRIAGERTARRLNARQLGTLECPVLFEAPEAADLIGCFVQAVSGGSLYRKSSFLPDSLGKEVFAPHIDLREEPHLPRGRGSAPFDSDGVATQPRDVVKAGVVQGYFLGSYSARKLGTGLDRQCGRQPQSRSGSWSGRPRGADAENGPRPVRHRTAGAGRQPGDRRLFARRRRLLDRRRRDRLSGRGDHHRRQPARHLSRHPGRRQRRGPAGFAPHRDRYWWAA